MTCTGNYRAALERNELLLESDQNKAPTDWSSMDAFCFSAPSIRGTGYDLWVLPVSGDKSRSLS